MQAGALGCAGGLLLASLVAHAWLSGPDEPIFVYTIPVVVAAIGAGPLGGYAAAAISSALLLVWPPELQENTLHLTLGLAALFLVAGLVGHFSFDLRRTAARRDWLLERAEAGLIELDSRDRIAMLSGPAREQLHAAPDELVGTPIADILPGLPADSARADLIAKRPDGTTLPVEATVSRAGHGGTVALRDLTERHRIQVALSQNEERGRALIALHASERRFRSAVDTMLDCFGIFSAVRDPAGEIADFECAYVNHAAAREIGWPSGRIRGERLSALWPDSRALELYRSVVETGQPVQVELLRVEPATGEERMFDVRAVQLEDGYAATWRDITDEIRIAAEVADASRELERSNTALEEFARVITHDLTEPLWTISLFAQTLEKQASRLDPQAQDLVSQMVRSLAWMQERVSDLLVHAQLRGDALKWEPVEAQQTVREALNALTASARAKSASVDVGTLPSVFGDHVQIRQLFQNLLSNAIKYSQDNVAPVVEISARSEDGRSHFEISDNGIGIAESDRERIFQVFERANTQGRPGSGIGLAVCRKIVEAHGGQIWAEARPGGGATFHLTLPSAPSA